MIKEKMSGPKVQEHIEHPLKVWKGVSCVAEDLMTVHRFVEGLKNVKVQVMLKDFHRRKGTDDVFAEWCVNFVGDHTVDVSARTGFRALFW